MPRLGREWIGSGVKFAASSDLGIIQVGTSARDSPDWFPFDSILLTKAPELGSVHAAISSFMGERRRHIPPNSVLSSLSVLVPLERWFKHHLSVETFEVSLLLVG